MTLVQGEFDGGVRICTKYIVPTDNKKNWNNRHLQVLFFLIVNGNDVNYEGIHRVLLA